MKIICTEIGTRNNDEMCHGYSKRSDNKLSVHNRYMDYVLFVINMNWKNLSRKFPLSSLGKYVEFKCMN